MKLLLPLIEWSRYIQGTARESQFTREVIEIVSETFIAQIDSKYNDSKYPYSININVVPKKALDAAKAPLLPVPKLNSTLSSCVPDVRDQVTSLVWVLKTDQREASRV